LNAEILPSLLWPPQYSQATNYGLTAQQAQDLGLEVLVRALDWDGRHAHHIRSVLMTLACDPAVIAYRQAILAELSAKDRLREALATLLPQLAELARPHSTGWAQESPLLKIPPRLVDLELYIACLNDLHAVLSIEQDLRSQGLRNLRDYLTATLARDDVQALAAELPALRSQFDKVASITVGINLDRDLRPASVTMVAISSEPFIGPRTLAGRLLGRSAAPGTPGMTVLRDVLGRSPNVDPLARDFQQVLEEVVRPVAVALERYERVQARPLAALESEFAFYLGAVQLAQRLTAHGLPVALPEVVEQGHVLHEAYNPSLALQLACASADRATSAVLVRNLVDFDVGQIVFLTGPNRGGKTTYLRAIGLNQVLFQAGLWVAAAGAHMSPVDAILTHFPPVEGVEPGGGRLDDEARRLREIFARATPASLLLLNEPLTSTAESEALILAGDILRALQLLGARTVYVTHLHALAEMCDTLNSRDAGTTIRSWIAEVDGGTPTYTIRPGKPAARSYAQRIAQQHGITFEQLAQQLAERGVVQGMRLQDGDYSHE
jgi:DNA mismatch repair protein MutS